jgi:NADPH-dependent ferric siderophore reductase
MEQNEQKQESTEVSESTGVPAAKVASETVEARKEEITEQMALVKIEGQEFELEASLAQDDKTIKMVLQPHFSSVENANITREVKDGKLTVTIVKKAQHKGHRIVSV